MNDISPYCEKHHFGMRNGLFQELKSTILRTDMGLIRPRNGHYQKSKRTFPDYETGYIIRRYCPESPLLYVI